MNQTAAPNSPSHLAALSSGLLLAALCLACNGDDGGGQDGDGTDSDTSATGVTVSASDATDDVQPDGTADETADDTSGDDAVTETIGPDGGTITSADGLLTLTFPAGALTEPVEISIGVAGAADEIEGASRTYVLGPDGQQFAQPVDATFTVSWESMQEVADTVALDLVIGPNAALIYPIVVESDGVLEVAENQALDMASQSGSGFLSGALNHFSKTSYILADLDDELRYWVKADFETLLGVGDPPRVGSAEGSSVEIVSVVVDPSDPMFVSVGPIVNLDDGSVWAGPVYCEDEGTGFFDEEVVVEFPVEDAGGLIIVANRVRFVEPFECTASACTPSDPAPDLAPTVADAINRGCRGDRGFIGGTNFNPGTNCLGLGNSVIEATATTDSFLNFVIPTTAKPGLFDVTINTGGGTATSSTPTEVLDQDAAVLQAVAPLSAASGSEFTISGEHLDQISSIEFGPGYSSTITDQTAASLTFTLFGSPGPAALSLAVMNDCNAQGGMQLANIEVTLE